MIETVESSHLLEVRGDKPLQIQEDLDGVVDRTVDGSSTPVSVATAWL